MADRRALRALLLICVAVALFYALLPAFEGYHLGYSPPDNQCGTSLVLNWCTYDPHQYP